MEQRVPAYKHLQVEQSDGIATITLNRPDAANGLNMALGSELADVAAQCNSHTSVRAVILTGKGRFFSAGGDVKEMASYGEEIGGGIKALADTLHRALSSFARMPAPLIVAVNGMAAGAGFSMAIAGDYVLAAEEAAFTMAYSKVGLCPDGGASYSLPRLVGLRKAQELMFTNRILSAQEAMDWGLVNTVVPADQLLGEAQAIAKKIASVSPDSNACIKKLLLASPCQGLETQMELEARSIAACAISANGREGVAAFMEKRKPSFIAKG